MDEKRESDIHERICDKLSQLCGETTTLACGMPLTLAMATEKHAGLIIDPLASDLSRVLRQHTRWLDRRSWGYLAHSGACDAARRWVAHGQVLVACASELEPVYGWVCYHRDATTRPDPVVYCYVRMSYRGLGVGRKLLRLLDK